MGLIGGGILIKLLIVDDEALIRDSIKMRLKDAPDIYVIGTACNGKEALRACIDQKPDVVLMDIRMPEMDGLEAAKLIKQENSDIKVLLLTSFFGPENINKAMEYGCNGFITKETKLDDFISIIRNVYKGFDVWSADLSYRRAGQIINADEVNELNVQEFEIVKCVTKGMKHSDIAKQLNFSEGYLRQLIMKINEKLGLQSSRDLAVWGARHGM